jgi:dTDP-4-dehydrorhamnose 3,5-epimerase-like enzyme
MPNATQLYQIIKFNVFGDKRGSLVSLESNKNIPFDIKRIYYMYNTSPEWVRGKHAHKTLKQVLVAIDGACTVVLDDGKYRQKVLLNRPDIGLYISNCLWREMKDFSYGCKLMVLASQLYDEKDYIKDYDEFLAEIKHKQQK